MAKQKLNGAQVMGATVDQRGLGAAQGMRAVGRRIEPDGANPSVDDPGILPCRNMGRIMQPTGEQECVRLELGLGDPAGDGIAGLLGDLELDRTLGLVLHDDGARRH